MLTSYCLQVQSSAGGPRKYSGPVSVVRSLHREGGLRSIFRGSAATAARGRRCVEQRSGDLNMLSDPTSCSRVEEEFPAYFPTEVLSVKCFSPSPLVSR